MEDIKDKIDETENVMKSISDFFGALFETHGHLTMELVNEIINNYIPIVDRQFKNVKIIVSLLMVTMDLHQEMVS